MNALLLFCGVLGGLDLGVGLTSEVRAGLMPIQVGVASDAVSELELTPAFQAQLRGARAAVRLRYFPRLLLRLPDVGLGRPLYLHQGELQTEWRPSSRLRFLASGTARVGELDYGALVFLFQQGQGSTLPGGSVTEYFEGTGRFQAVYQVARRTEVGLEFEDNHVRPLGTSSVAGGLIAADRVTVSPHIAWTLSPRDRLRLTGAFTRHWLGGGQRFSLFLPTLEWTRRLSRWSSLELGAGAAYATSNVEAARVIGHGQAGLRGVVMNRRGLQWALEGRLLFTPLVSPVDGTLDPRVGLRLATTLTFSEAWSAGLQGEFFTVATSVPRPAAAGDDTAFSLALPVIHQSGRHRFEFGMRASARGPHPSDPNFAFGSELLLGYFAYAVSEESGRLARSYAPVLPQGPSQGEERAPTPEAERQAEEAVREAELREAARREAQEALRRQVEAALQQEAAHRAAAEGGFGLAPVGTSTTTSAPP